MLFCKLSLVFFSAVVLIYLFCSVESARVVQYNIKNFGAKGDGKTKDTLAIRKAIETIAAQAKPSETSLLLFPKGIYLTGNVNLTSNLIIQLEKGCEILGSEDEEDYPLMQIYPSYGEGRDIHNTLQYSPLFLGYQVENVTLQGEDASSCVINGNGHIWWKRKKDHLLQFSRSRLIEFAYSKSIVLQGITFKNPAFWNIHPIYCDQVSIHHCRVEAPIGSPNTDGIDPDSSTNVQIFNNIISSGDDHISVKSGIDYCGRLVNKPSENISIFENTFLHGAGVAIGSEMSGGVKNVFISNNTITFGDNFVRIKSGRGRGGFIDNIFYENNSIQGALNEAIRIDMYYAKQDQPTNATATPVIKNITVKNLHLGHVESFVRQAYYLRCLPESPCNSLHFEDITLHALQGNTCEKVTNGTFVHLHPSLSVPCD